MSHGDPAIAISGLTKRFGELVAVDAVAFDVPVGALYGFLGPNGSGKTTTLGMLTGLIPADAGTARVMGVDVREDPRAALAQVGALIEEPAFYPYLNGRDNLRVLARLTGDERAEGVDGLLRRVGLDEAAGAAKYKGYSMGMRRRLALAAALLGDPPVLVLDEPTNGLDPAGQREVAAMLKEMAAAGKTILVSSHILPEVQAMCSHVAILAKGRVLRAGTLADILGDAAERLSVIVDDVRHAEQVARGVPGVADVRIDHNVLEIDAPYTLAGRLNRALVEAGVEVSGLKREIKGLEARFFEMTDEQQPDGEPEVTP